MAKSPFPGMDPYLEEAGIWPGLHSRLQNIFADTLSQLLAPKYIADFDTQVVIDYAEGFPGDDQYYLPDVTIARTNRALSGVLIAEPIAPAPLRLLIPRPLPTRLLTLQIRERASERLVTVIELLSPVNKRPGSKRQEYIEKRNKYFDSNVHFVEMDLLRSWPKMPMDGYLPPCDYVITVSDYTLRPEAEVWPLSVRQPLPTILIPLLPPDPPVQLDIGDALRIVYERARYDLRIDYSKPPKPPLSPDDAVWAAALITSQKEQEL